MNSRLKLVLFASYPNVDLPHWGIFNARAARSLMEWVDVEVISIRTWKPGRPFKQTIVEDGLTIHHTFIPHVPTNSSGLFKLSGVITRWFLRFYLGNTLKKADVFHSVGGAPKGVYLAPLAMQLKKKHLLQLIGGDVNTDLPELLRNKALGNFPQGIDCVVGNSSVLVKQFNALFQTHFPEAFVYRGTDLQRFSFEAMPSTTEGVRFLFIGGFSHYAGSNHGMNTKGGPDLMEAWLEQEEELVKCGASLSLGGPDSENAEPWISRLKYPERVQNIGVLKPEDVRSQYIQHHIVIIPSMEEGLPNVAVEASASGRVVLASNAGGTPEVVDSQTGLIFTKGDRTLLGEALVDYAQGAVDIVQQGQLARKKMEKYFDKSQFGLKYLKHYQTMLQAVCAE